MKVYVIAQGTIKDHAMLEKYISEVLPTIWNHDGKLVALDETPEVIEGEIDNPRTVILKFPSREKFNDWYNSPEYQKILPLRLNSVTGRMVLAKSFQQINPD